MKNKIIEASELIERFGLTYYKEGNISIKDNDNIFITKSGVIKGILKESDILIWNMHDNPPQGITSEWRLHSEVYKNTSYTSVLHLHPMYVSIVSVNSSLFKPVIQEDEEYIKNIGFIEDFRWGSKELADAVGEKVKEKRILILKKHGIVMCGDDIVDLVYEARGVESMCKRMVINSLLRRDV